jgi:hypothetical protein
LDSSRNGFLFIFIPVLQGQIVWSHGVAFVQAFSASIDVAIVAGRSPDKNYTGIDPT